jgi:hypothetical protein
MGVTKLEFISHNCALAPSMPRRPRAARKVCKLGWSKIRPAREPQWGWGFFEVSVGGKATENCPEFYRKLFLVGLKRIWRSGLVKNLNEPRAEIDQPKRLVLKGRDFSTELLCWSDSAGNLLAFAVHDQYKLRDIGFRLSRPGQSHANSHT